MFFYVCSSVVAFLLLHSSFPLKHPSATLQDNPAGQSPKQHLQFHHPRQHLQGHYSQQHPQVNQFHYPQQQPQVATKHFTCRSTFHSSIPRSTDSTTHNSTCSSHHQKHPWVNRLHYPQQHLQVHGSTTKSSIQRSTNSTRQQHLQVPHPLHPPQVHHHKSIIRSTKSTIHNSNHMSINSTTYTYLQVPLPDTIHRSTCRSSIHDYMLRPTSTSMHQPEQHPQVPYPRQHL